MLQSHTKKTIPASNIVAWLGPCIGPGAFEVGDEVRAAFTQFPPIQPAAAALFQPGATGKWWADLAGLARLRLQAMGVTQVYGNDSTPGWCTVGNPLHFFSYRRDQHSLGGSGRLAACVWLERSGG